MTILIPDSVFDDGHEAEHAAAAPLPLAVRHAAAAGDLAADDWAAAEAIVAYHRMHYGAEIADLAAGVRILVRAGVSVDNVDLAVWQARGVAVCNVPDYGIAEVADHALALMLALLRGVGGYHGRVLGTAAGEVPAWPLPGAVRRIAGLNCLVVGFGAIGKAFAARARALGMSVGFHDPGLPPGAWDATSVHRHATLDDGLAAADVVSLHLPLSAATAGLIGAGALARMKPGAVLINTARGGLVDTAALCAALESGHLGGAGLDVVEDEPLGAGNPLARALADDVPWARGRVVLSPHIGGISPQSLVELRRRAVATARDFLVDGVLHNRVNG